MISRPRKRSYPQGILAILLGAVSIWAGSCRPVTSDQLPVTSDQVTVTSEQPATNNKSQVTNVTPSLSPPPLSPTPLPLKTPTPCSPDLCTVPGHFWLERPFAPDDNDSIDVTYRYGSTQEGNRPTHHGVEFVNPEGTPVLAAADGLVIVAGDDYQTAYANFPFFYGNLVIIQHDFPALDQPVFTLYGHLSAVQAQVGDYVHTGDQIGLVGYTGVAEWSHLHFEVRVGKNRYHDTRNPELWLRPHQDDDGNLNGAIAGRVLDEFGSLIYIPNVVIERLASNGEEVLATTYVETYADFTVNGDDTWRENFVISDLPPGKYRVTFVARGLQVWIIEVLPGQVTVLVFDAREIKE